MKEVTIEKVGNVYAVYSIFLLFILIGILACAVLPGLEILDIRPAGYIIVGLILLGGLVMYLKSKHLKSLRNRLPLPVINDA